MAVAGGAIEFTPLSFAELWDSWEDEGVWEGDEERLEYLRSRYTMEL
jgi:hypothetical protein